MNRDGYRSGRDVAEHEAAHAVVAILSGLAIGRVSIAPTLSQRGYLGGWIEPGRKILRMCNGKPVLAPITETADLDTLAAGYTWETEVLDHTEDEAGVGGRHPPRPAEVEVEPDHGRRLGQGDPPGRGRGQLRQAALGGFASRACSCHRLPG